jgi:hypothetical protein
VEYVNLFLLSFEVQHFQTETTSRRHIRVQDFDGPCLDEARFRHAYPAQSVHKESSLIMFDGGLTKELLLSL